MNVFRRKYSLKNIYRILLTKKGLEFQLFKIRIFVCEKQIHICVLYVDVLYIKNPYIVFFIFVFYNKICMRAVYIMIDYIYI